MNCYTELSHEELLAEFARVNAHYEAILNQKLSLDLTRGKPSKEQLDLSNGLFATVKPDDDFLLDGVDVRNYGTLGGLPSTKRYFAELLGVKPENMFVGGNASLTLMYDVISKAYTFGLPSSLRPWRCEEKIKMLCPAPGYDRHFAINREFGFEMIAVPMTEEGPDLAFVQEQVKDPAVKGIWCVPKYSNPDGYVYSESVCRGFAELKPAAPDFLVIWDNAYCMHSLYGAAEEIPEILELCRENGCPNRVFQFASTSKMTYAGSGVSVLASSPDNMDWYVQHSKPQAISYSKLNELMHVRFLKDKATTAEHMAKHADILRPKFEAVLAAFESELSPLGIARWISPKGGYFISLYVMAGTAKSVAELCAKAGVKLTPAGATYPYGKDPMDSNLRIAPSYATLEEVEKASMVLCVAIKLAALRSLLNQ